MSTAQFDLFGAKKLRELQAENERLRQELTAVRATARTILEQRFEAEDKLAIVTRERDFWRGMVSGNAAPRSQPCLEIWMGQELRKLIIQTHPDKWNQGQPATELAYELSVALNALRARLGVQP